MAQSIIKGAASSAGSRIGDTATAAIAGGAAGAASAAALAGHSKVIMPPIPNEDNITDPMEMLRARIERLEHAMFITKDPVVIQKEGDAVAQALKKIRGGK
jgi:hypothetical protein